MKDLPSGTVTFLFTDIEGSTRLWENAPEKMQAALQRHHEILRCAIESHDGAVFQIVGDAFCAAFFSAPSSLSAAVKAQQSLFGTNWDLPTPIRVRMGIHTGLAEPLTSDSTTGGYTSNQTLNRVARIMSSGHGGQILLSLATEELARDFLPQDSCLQDLGEHHLRDVIHPEHLFQLNISGLPFDFPPLKTLQPPRHNLPVQLTDFIGRQKELSEIDYALAQNRLVTIIGTGGSGKTRLAIEAGAVQVIGGQADHRFSNGVCFVTLAPLGNIDAIVPTIASALGFSFRAGDEPRQQLLDYLREKSLLLILDNFEHLLAGAGLVREILDAASGVKILVTSRIRLNLEGEQLFHLTGMEFPNWESPQDASEYNAVQLFLQTAHRVCPAFELTKENRSYVVRLCRLVDGMPLGILLAASWMEMLSAEEIVGEIEKSLDFLETRQSDLPERQHSMRAVFDYSWKLLTLEEQNVFMKASVFRGGFTREAAQQVTGAPLRDLLGLVEKSLIQRHANGRYEIHELLRQYGAEKLRATPDASDAAGDQHSAYFADYLYQRETLLSGRKQNQTLNEIATEIENIRVAWNWAITHEDIERLDHSLASLARFYSMRSRFQECEAALSAATKCLESNCDRHPDSFVKLVAARIQLYRGDNYIYVSGEKAIELTKASLVTFHEMGDLKYEAMALYQLGYTSQSIEEAKGYFQQGLLLSREVGDRIGEANCLGMLGGIAADLNQLETSKDLFRKSLAIFHELGNQDRIATVLVWSAVDHWQMGDYETAKRLIQESLEYQSEISQPAFKAIALRILATAVMGLGNFDESLQILQKSLSIAREIGAINIISDALFNLSELYIVTKKYSLARQAAEELVVLTRESQSRILTSSSILGEILAELGDLQTARGYIRRALVEATAPQTVQDKLIALRATASFLARNGECEKALMLMTLINCHPIASQWIRDRSSELIVKLETELSPDIVTQAKERGCARDLDATVTELLEELKE